MIQPVFPTCHCCGNRVSGNRRYCSSSCRRTAKQNQFGDPTPEEIREMCRLIRLEGGETWERTRTCYPAQPFRVPTLRTNWDFSSLSE